MLQPSKLGKMNHQEFIEVGKVPDYVKELPIFEGHAPSLSRWILEVEGVLKLYERLPKPSLEYSILEGTIRRKIKGEAAVLNSNCVTGDWNSIKRTLLLYYKDKRDHKTLDYGLTIIQKGSLSHLVVILAGSTTCKQLL